MIDLEANKRRYYQPLNNLVSQTVETVAVNDFITSLSKIYNLQIEIDEISIFLSIYLLIYPSIDRFMDE